MKKVMYLVVWKAVQMDTEWESFTSIWFLDSASMMREGKPTKEKGKALGHIIRAITLIFALLKKDYEVPSTSSRLARNLLHRLCMTLSCTNVTGQDTILHFNKEYVIGLFRSLNKDVSPERADI